MTTTSKKKLVKFLESLDISQLNPQEQIELRSIVDFLTSKEVRIPSTLKSATEITHLTELIFCAYPDLMTDDNRQQYNNYITDTDEEPPRKRPKY